MTEIKYDTNMRQSNCQEINLRITQTHCKSVGPGGLVDYTVLAATTSLLKCKICPDPPMSSTIMFKFLQVLCKKNACMPALTEQ